MITRRQFLKGLAAESEVKAVWGQSSFAREGEIIPLQD